MRAIIIGGGDVGHELAVNLLEKKHNVVMIDKSKEVTERLMEEFDILAIQGNGANLDILKKAKIGSAKMLIAVTESDEINIIACMLAKTFDVPVTVARVRDPESAGSIDIDTRGLTQKQVGIDLIISPEKAVSLEIAKLIHFPDAEEVEYFGKGHVKLAKITVPADSGLAGRASSRVPLPEGCRITGIIGKDGKLRIPEGTEIINPGDTVYLLGSIEAMREVSRIVHPEQIRIDRVVILGGGMIGLYLASALEETRGRSFVTKIIEQDPVRAEELDRIIGKTIVVRGDGSEISYYNEEELSEADVVVTVTGDDRTNIVASMVSKKLGVPKIISEVRSIGYRSIYKAADIEDTVNPHMITASQILRFTHTEDVVSFSLLKGEAEVMERILTGEGKLTGKTIRDADFPKGLLVGAILRDEHVFIPSQNTVLNENDHLILFSKPGVCANVDACFI